MWEVSSVGGHLDEPVNLSEFQEISIKQGRPVGNAHCEVDPNGMEILGQHIDKVGILDGIITGGFFTVFRFDVNAETINPVMIVLGDLNNDIDGLFCVAPHITKFINTVNTPLTAKESKKFRSSQ